MIATKPMFTHMKLVQWMSDQFQILYPCHISLAQANTLMDIEDPDRLLLWKQPATQQLIRLLDFHLTTQLAKLFGGSQNQKRSFRLLFEEFEAKQLGEDFDVYFDMNRARLDGYRLWQSREEVLMGVADARIWVEEKQDTIDRVVEHRDQNIAHSDFKGTSPASFCDLRELVELATKIYRHIHVNIEGSDVLFTTQPFCNIDLLLSPWVERQRTQRESLERIAQGYGLRSEQN